MPDNTTFRRTNGIVSRDGDPLKEADVIMTAAALGLAASFLQTEKKPIHFDYDPLDTEKDAQDYQKFQRAVRKMDDIIAKYMGVDSGRGAKDDLSPGYEPGAVIIGVYAIAGKKKPEDLVVKPVLSDKGKVLYDQIVAPSSKLHQYTGRGAYTGFVDNPEKKAKTDPVGPLSTARFVAFPPGLASHPRWLPSDNSPLWEKRTRSDDTRVPWGLIGGNLAKVKLAPGSSAPTYIHNTADAISHEMCCQLGMRFNGEPDEGEIAMYTHGMIQAIYKAYDLSPGCVPHEIAVGDKTKKMASCLPCTLFMYAAGYPPNSIHLGRGESWTPLYEPYNPTGEPVVNKEIAVVRDLNNAWYEKCLAWLSVGLSMLTNDNLMATHTASRDLVMRYLDDNQGDGTVGGVLILDAITCHESEYKRIDRTLK